MCMNKLFNEELYSDAITNAIRCANIKFDIFECNKVIFKGTPYKIGDAVIIRKKKIPIWCSGWKNMSYIDRYTGNKYQHCCRKFYYNF